MSVPVLDHEASPAGPGAAARRRPRLRTLLAVGLALLAAGALVWVLLGSALLDVRQVEVRGAVRATPAQVRAAAQVRFGTPLARIDLGAVRRRVAGLDAVAQVDVRRAWPHTLQVEVVERRPVVGFLTSGAYVLIDGTGKGFARVPALPAGVPRLQVPAPGPGDPATRAALQVLGRLPADLRTRLAILRAPAPGAVTLLLRNGRQVLWGAPGDDAGKAQAAEALLRLPGTVYDVSSPAVVTRK